MQKPSDDMHGLWVVRGRGQTSVKGREVTMATRKTKLMKKVEKKQGGVKLEILLPRLFNENEYNLTDIAKLLGVSMATVSYWIIKLQFKLRTVLLAPGETLEIKRIS